MERFCAFIVTTTDGCWLWQGHLSDGYGVLRTDEGMQKAHRWAYEYFIGPIPEGLQLDHLCMHRSCVNPLHTEPVTQRENIRRSPTSAAAVNARRTHCTSGHLFDEKNTRIDKRTGWRVCRACNNTRVLAWKAAHPKVA